MCRNSLSGLSAAWVVDPRKCAMQSPVSRKTLNVPVVKRIRVSSKSSKTRLKQLKGYKIDPPDTCHRSSRE
jgi:hypothetical protein